MSEPVVTWPEYQPTKCAHAQMQTVVFEEWQRMQYDVPVPNIQRICNECGYSETLSGRPRQRDKSTPVPPDVQRWMFTAPFSVDDLNNAAALTV